MSWGTGHELHTDHRIWAGGWGQSQAITHQQASRVLCRTLEQGSQPHTAGDKHQLVPHRKLQQEFVAAWDFPTRHCTLTTLTQRKLCAYDFICLHVSRGRGKLLCKPLPLSWHLHFVEAILDWALNNDSVHPFVSLDTLGNLLQAEAGI